MWGTSELRRLLGSRARPSQQKLSCAELVGGWGEGEKGGNKEKLTGARNKDEAKDPATPATLQSLFSLPSSPANWDPETDYTGQAHSFGHKN